MMARSRRPFVVVISGASRSACACFSDSQFPMRTPIDFALFTRAMPAASSGAAPRTFATKACGLYRMLGRRIAAMNPPTPANCSAIS